MTIHTTENMIFHQMSTCSICVESYNRSTRRPSTCPFCSNTICLQCQKAYQLTRPLQPSCMNCDRSFDRSILVTLLPMSFVETTLRSAQVNLLLTREKGLLTETRRQLERDREIAHLLNQLLSGAEEDSIFARLDQLFTPSLRVACFRGCQTFLVDNYCSSCQLTFCPDCGEEVRDEVRKTKDEVTKDEVTTKDGAGLKHICDPEQKEAYQLLKTQTKNCPSCLVPIHKLEGCDHMWCPQCQTHFDWSTLQISDQARANPEFARHHQEREVTDVQCGGLPNLEIKIQLTPKEDEFMARRIQRVEKYGYSEDELMTIAMHDLLAYIRQQPIAGLTPTERQLRLSIFHRQLLELEETDRFRFNPVNELREYRLQFLTEKITETQWKAKLSRHLKVNDKNKALRPIVATYLTICGDLFRNNQPDLLEQLTEATRVINEQLVVVGRMFKNQPVVIVEGRVGKN